MADGGVPYSAGRNFSEDLGGTCVGECIDEQDLT